MKSKNSEKGKLFFRILTMDLVCLPDFIQLMISQVRHASTAFCMLFMWKDMQKQSLAWTLGGFLFLCVFVCGWGFYFLFYFIFLWLNKALFFSSFLLFLLKFQRDYIQGIEPALSLLSRHKYQPSYRVLGLGDEEALHHLLVIRTRT